MQRGRERRPKRQLPDAQFPVTEEKGKGVKEEVNQTVLVDAGLVDTRHVDTRPVRIYTPHL